ncbi:MAG: hypothetical protein ICV54_24920 [Nostoc sp. C3-bin3]|nr:hypothetical protein [Nostoc sp. C3-bin3]
MSTPTQFLIRVLCKGVAFLMQGNALTLQADTLALQRIAKFNLLGINEMLYLD